MKKLITTTLVSAALAASMSVTTPVKANDFLVLATSLCEYTKANDRNEIRKTLKKSRVKIRRIYNDIQCNGLSLYDFAKSNNSDDVAAFYRKKVLRS